MKRVTWLDVIALSWILGFWLTFDTWGDRFFMLAVAAAIWWALSFRIWMMCGEGCEKSFGKSRRQPQRGFR